MKVILAAGYGKRLRPLLISYRIESTSAASLNAPSGAMLISYRIESTCTHTTQQHLQTRVNLL